MTLINKDIKSHLDFCISSLSPYELQQVLIFVQSLNEKKVSFEDSGKDVATTEEDPLKYRLEMEKLVANISGRFINVGLKDIDEEINRALRVMGEFVGAEGSYIYLQSPESKSFEYGYEWHADGIERKLEKLQGFSIDGFPWLTEKLIKGEYLNIPDVEKVPPEAEKEKKFWQLHGDKAILSIPLFVRHIYAGFFGFRTESKEKYWKEEDINLLKLAGEMFVNVLERKKSEECGREIGENLRRSEATLKSILKAAPVGVGLVTNRVIGWTNDFITEMTGYTPEELDGKNARIFYESDEEFYQVSKIKHGIMKEKGTGSIETRWITKDGRILDIFLSSSFIVPGDFSAGLVFTAMDITDRKLAEQALRKSENKYRTLFSSMHDGFVLHEILYNDYNKPVDYIILEANSSFEELTGLKRIECTGKKASEVYTASGALVYIEVFSRVAETGVAETFEAYFSDIKKYFKISVYSPEKGKFATIFSDITEAKKSEEAIKQLNTELLEKNEELQQIIYVASHDLRSPLINIQGFGKELEKSINNIKEVLYSQEDVHLIRNEISYIFEEDILVSLSYILTGATKMHLLLSGLLRLSRLGRSAVKIKKLNISRVVSDVVESFKFRIKELGVTVKVNDLPDCRGDEVMIVQIFSNLIDNALKYLHKNRPGLIEISGYKKDKLSVYCVEDNGKGILPEYHEKIFEIFHKLDSNLPGEGLGLTIVKKILERHNGKIWVESEERTGSKFFISLPS